MPIDVYATARTLTETNSGADIAATTRSEMEARSSD
jgi:hypothetical protein